MAWQVSTHGWWLWLFAAALPHRVNSQVDEFSVVAGRHFSFLVDNRVVKATGRNNYGQLGIGSTVDHQLELVDVDLPLHDRDVKEVAAGGFHSLFLTEQGNVYAAGWNRFGQLGIGSNIDQRSPVRITLPDSVTVAGVAAGYGHSLFLLSDGTVQAAGLNYAGQLGDGTTSCRNTPSQVNLGSLASNVAAGYDFSYFLMGNGTVWATGQNLGGQLGDGSRQTRLNPVEVQLEGRAIDIAAGESHGLFLLADKTVSGTGANFDGQLGDDTIDAKAIPTTINISDAGDSRVVSAGGDSSCLASGSDRWLLCMGSNRDGQLGFGSSATMTVPSRVPDVPDFVESVALADTHSLFLAHPGDVFITGSNTFGELGDTTTDARDRVTVLMRLNFTATTKTSTTDTATTITATSSTITGTTTTSSTTTTTSTTTTSEVDRFPKAPENQEWVALLGAVTFGVAGLLINVVCQRRALSQLEENDEEGEARAQQEMEMAEAPNQGVFETLAAGLQGEGELPQRGPEISQW